MPKMTGYAKSMSKSGSRKVGAQNSNPPDGKKKSGSSQPMRNWNRS